MWSSWADASVDSRAEPDTIKWEQERPAATRVEVPFVTGAFVLVGALSREECAQIMACAEEMGYTVSLER